MKEENNNKMNKNNIIRDIIYVIISIGIILYMIFIVAPVGDEGYFFNEGRNPEESLVTRYKLMITPVFIGYLIYSGLKLDIVNKYMKFLVYPITIITILILLFFWLSTGGGGAIWLLFLIVPVLSFFLYIWFKLIAKIKNKLLKNIRND